MLACTCSYMPATCTIAYHCLIIMHADCIGFPCDDGGCTTLFTTRCDGTDDCADGSDEANCGKWLDAEFLNA